MVSEEKEKEEEKSSEEERRLKQELEDAEKRFLNPRSVLSMVLLSIVLAVLSGNTGAAEVFICFLMSFMSMSLVWLVLTSSKEIRLEKKLMMLNYGEILFEDSLTGWKKQWIINKQMFLLRLFLAVSVLTIFDVFAGATIYLGMVVGAHMALVAMAVNSVILSTQYGPYRVAETSFPVKVTTTGIHIDRSTCGFVPKEKITSIILEKRNDELSTLFLGRPAHAGRVHVGDGEAFLSSLKGIVGDRWDDIFLDKEDLTSYGETTFEDSLKGWRKLWKTERARFLTDIFWPMLILGLMNGILEIYLIFLLFSIEAEIYYKLAGFLFLNLLLVLWFYVLYKSSPPPPESQAVKLTTKGIDFKTMAPYFLRFSKVDKIILEKKETEFSVVSVLGGESGKWMISVADIERFLETLEKVYGDSWSDVFIDNVAKKMGFEKYSSLKDKKNLKSCPVCDIALEPDVTECPLCQLDLSGLKDG